MGFDSRAFDRILIIMFENEYRHYVMENSYMRGLAARGIDMANYFGVMHPSTTNYVASVAGELCNVSADPNPMPGAEPFQSLGQSTIVDLIEHSVSGLQWGAYMQSYVKMLWDPKLKPADFPLPFPCPSGLWDASKPIGSYLQPLYPYMFWHNPFCLFDRILGSQERWSKIEDEGAFWRDIAKGDLPHYAWFTPNMWNDGHYSYGKYGLPEAGRAPILVDQLAGWLKSFFGDLGFPGPDSLLPPRTLVVVTFDESDFDTEPPKPKKPVGESYDGPNQIYTVLLGDMIEPAVELEGYNHYSLLKTIEKNFGLGNLGKNDVDANCFQFLWNRRFRWGRPQATPITAANGILAAASLEGRLHVVCANECGELSSSTFYAGNWSCARPIGTTASAVRLAAHGTKLMLFGQTQDGCLDTLTYDPNGGWSPQQTIADDVPGSFAVTAYFDHGDQVENLMLAYRTAGKAINYRVFSDGQWSKPEVVCKSTDGDLTLAAIGPSLYLIHQLGKEMMVVSYNTADYNVVTAADDPSNDTTINTWSPSEYPVAHFSRGPGANETDTGINIPPYAGGAPLAAAALDGVIHLAHPGAGNAKIITETFSIAGIMTPAKAVVYKSDAKNASNGYGTLAEAGWSAQQPIDGAYVRPDGAMTMCRVGSQLSIVFQSDDDDGNVYLCVGGYRPDD